MRIELNRRLNSELQWFDEIKKPLQHKLRVSAQAVGKELLRMRDAGEVLVLGQNRQKVAKTRESVMVHLCLVCGTYDRQNLGPKSRATIEHGIRKAMKPSWSGFRWILLIEGLCSECAGEYHAQQGPNKKTWGKFTTEFFAETGLDSQPPLPWPSSTIPKLELRALRQVKPRNAGAAG